MKRLPEDLLQFLQSNKLGDKQRKLICELALEYGQMDVSVAEYVRRYVNRSLRISKALDGSLI